jgi:hypothetical protein
MKLGFFEKWNQDAGAKEFSITRLQMAFFTVFAAFFIYQYYITEENSVTINSLVLVIIILLGAFVPKALKDFSDIKNKLGK